MSSVTPVLDEGLLALLEAAGIPIPDDARPPRPQHDPTTAYLCRDCGAIPEIVDQGWVCIQCGLVPTDLAYLEGTNDLPANLYEREPHPIASLPHAQGNASFRPRYYVRRRVGYKRKNHFVAHLQRFLAQEPIDPPASLLNRLRDHLPDPSHPHAYQCLRDLLKTLKLPQWYPHIHSLLVMLGGKSEHLPTDVHRSIMTEFQRLDYLLTHNNLNARYRKSLSGYSVLLEVMLDHHGVRPHYQLPSMKSTSRHDELYAFYHDILYRKDDEEDIEEK